MEEVKIVNVTLEEVRTMVEEVIDSKMKDFTVAARREENSKPFYTRKEVAQLFSITLPTVHKWSKSGWLNPIKIDSSVRYSFEDLMRLGHERSLRERERINKRR